MNINLLIALIALLLGSIYVLFKPLHITDIPQGRDIPILEIRDFTMYELTPQKLIDISSGKRAVRYKERYELFDFIFTDNSNKEILSISAERGLYKADTLTLHGDVLYTRSDGLDFTTQQLFYNRKKGTLLSSVPYTAHLGKSVLHGSYLFYDINKKFLRSKNVDALYYLTK